MQRKSGPPLAAVLLRGCGSLQSRNFVLFRNYLEGHRDELGVADLELAGFVCVTSIEALTHNAVLHHSEMLRSEAVETLVDEATRLVVGYLRGRTILNQNNSQQT
jgi:hypothetical protein